MNKEVITETKGNRKIEKVIVTGDNGEFLGYTFKNLTMDTDFDASGLENVLVAIIEQSRKDYINGYIALKNRYRRIPDSKEFYRDHTKYVAQIGGKTGEARREWKKMKDFFEVREFIISDPYGCLQNDPLEIFKAWDDFAEKKIADKKKRESKKIKILGLN